MEDEVEDSSILSFSISFASDDDDSDDDRPFSRCAHCADTCLKCIFFPFVLVGTVLLVVLILVFGFIPFLLLLLMLLFFYYCCTREPIPPGVLIRALLDAEDTNREVLPQYTRQEIHASLIRRLCLGTLSLSPPHEQEQEEDLGKSLNEVASSHGGKVHLPDERDRFLVFSEPLTVAPDSEEEKEDEEEIRTVPHYYQQESIMPTAENEERRENENERMNTVDEEETETGQEANEAQLPKEEGPYDETQVDDGKAETSDAETKDNNDASSAASVELGESAEEGTPDEGGRLCSICLIHYQMGDIVAWSQNDQCDHFFHEDCITDWLLRKPTCPSCRQTYILQEATKGNDENV